MLVKNMVSIKTGKPVPNQFIIKIDRVTYFQSYNTVVAAVEYCGRAGEVTIINNAFDLSRTTSRYLRAFLGEYSLINEEFNNKKGIKKLIERGDIKTIKQLTI